MLKVNIRKRQRGGERLESHSNQLLFFKNLRFATLLIEYEKHTR